MHTIRSLLAGALLASATALAVAASPSTTSHGARASAEIARPASEIARPPVESAPPASSPWAGLDTHLICLPGEGPTSGVPANFA